MQVIFFFIYLVYLEQLEFKIDNTHVLYIYMGTLVVE